jgi:hypothetical protein
MDTIATNKTRLFLSLTAIFLLQGISYSVRSQTSPIESNNFDKSIRIYDETGHPLRNAAIEAVGSPYFLPNWKLGWIRLADNRVFTAVPLKLDLEQQEVHYKRSDGTDVAVQPGQVRQMAIVDTIAGIPVLYQFLSGFEPIDNQTETSFYLLLDSGRVTLLESLRKKLFQDKNAYAATFVKEYRLYNDLYVVKSGKMIRIKRDPKFFQQLTKDEQSPMEDFVQKNKISFKSEEDIRKYIDYYNGLATPPKP